MSDIKVNEIKTDTIKNQAGTNAMTIQSDGRVSLPTGIALPVQPAFSMYKSSGHASVNAIIVLNTGFNQGSHVNTSTGIFEPPVAGRYFFTAYSIKANANNSVARLQIRKNNAIQVEARMDETGNYTQANATVILDLVVGDSISFYNDDNAEFYMDGRYGRCSGYLIG